MKKAAAKTGKAQEPRLLNWGTNALLFMVNFFLLYFIWVAAAPGVTGLFRLFSSWLAAFALTWIIARQTRATARIFLTLAFMGLLIFVLLTSRG